MITYSQDPTYEAATFLEYSMQNALDSNQAVLFLISAGSALHVLEKINTDIFSNLVTISMGDERFSETSEDINYYTFMNSTFAREVLNKGVKVISTAPVDTETMQGTAARLQKNIQMWQAENPEGKIIYLLGAGPDGHTAGIAPGLSPAEYKELFTSQREVVGYDAHNKLQPSKRITCSISFMMQNVDSMCMYVSGESKNKMFQRLINPKEAQSIRELPARVIHSIKDSRIFTNIKPIF